MARFAGFIIAVFVISGIRPLRSEEIDFARDIRPILSDNCYHCHGPDEGAREADLRLDTKEGLLGEDSGIVVPGDIEDSELIWRLMTEDPDERMPPPDSNRSLTPAQIELIERWVSAGAQWRGHWSFQPMIEPELGTSSSPIDYFVGQRLAESGLDFAAEAEKARLLRRVTFDLTGLPPTLDELDAFLADDTADAYERVVDRLLESPHYGERMAWDWLDAARYADTNGFQGDRERSMWPWRDWVVRKFNENLPYDTFTVWQLAGDQLPDASLEQQLATGFCRNHMINGEGGRIPEENRIEYVFDQLETMGTVWLGLTLQCSRCHDHKFDPITQREYYELFAFFNQTPVDGSGGDPQSPPNIAYPSAQQQREIDQASQLVRQARAQLAQAESDLLGRLDDVADEDTRKSIQELLQVAVDKRNDDQFDSLSKLTVDDYPEVAAGIHQLREHRRQLDSLKRNVPRVMVMRDREQPRQTFMLNVGLYDEPRDEVFPGTPDILPPLGDPENPNRLALARWLVDPNHPLTARVTVNRYWQLFFGVGLVKTTEDFGVQGERPSHPELLEWLAHDFVSSGWDVKRLHKQIVMSRAYRQTSKSTPEAIANDPENRLIARGPRMRMPSWMIRDHALHCSGLLVTDLGGPPVNAYQPAGVWTEATFGNKRYVQGTGDDLYRRSLYSFWRRIVGPTMFFDESKRQVCSVRPGRTNTPLHALTTLNDITYVEAARALAERIMLAQSGDRERIELAFRRVTSRRPIDAELQILLDRLAILRAQYGADPTAAEKMLSIGESPRDADLAPIEHASFAGLCSLILNLDEALSK